MTVLVVQGPEISGAAVLEAVSSGLAARVHTHALGTGSILRRLLSLKADVLVFDLWLWGVRAAGEVQAVRRQFPDIPIVIVSVDNEETMKRVSRSLSAVVWISRVRIPVLPGILRQVCGQRASRGLFLQYKEMVLADSTKYEAGPAPMVTQSTVMRNAMRATALFLDRRQPVLLTGEPGSGRKTVARHLGIRLGRLPFRELDVHGVPAYRARRLVAAVVDEAVQTVCVPDIDELCPDTVELLKPFFTAGDGPVVIATARTATGGNALVRMLRRHRVEVPSLAARPEDIPLLVRYFLLQYGVPPSRLGDAFPRWLIPVLTGYRFPGNVGELLALTERIARSHRTITALGWKPFVSRDRLLSRLVS